MAAHAGAMRALPHRAPHSRYCVRDATPIPSLPGPWQIGCRAHLVGDASGQPGDSVYSAANDPASARGSSVPRYWSQAIVHFAGALQHGLRAGRRHWAAPLFAVPAGLLEASVQVRLEECRATRSAPASAFRSWTRIAAAAAWAWAPPAGAALLAERSPPPGYAGQALVQQPWAKPKGRRRAQPKSAKAKPQRGLRRTAGRRPCSGPSADAPTAAAQPPIPPAGSRHVLFETDQCHLQISRAPQRIHQSHQVAVVDGLVGA